MEPGNAGLGLHGRCLPAHGPHARTIDRGGKITKVTAMLNQA